MKLGPSVPGDQLEVATLLMAILIVAGLAACASTPQRNDQLEQARVTVQSLERDPEAQRAAAEQLRAARNDLRRANAAFEKHSSPEEVTHLAYLAQREAQAGKAYADEYRARQQLAQGNQIIGITSAKLGISRDEAAKRFDQWVTQFNRGKSSVEQGVRQAAGQAAGILSQASIWAFVALLLGAIVSALGGAWGTRPAVRASTPTAF